MKNKKIANLLKKFNEKKSPIFRFKGMIGIDANGNRKDIFFYSKEQEEVVRESRYFYEEDEDFFAPNPYILAKTSKGKVIKYSERSSNLKNRSNFKDSRIVGIFSVDEITRLN